MEATAATLERRVRVIPATRKPEELHRDHDGKMRVAAYCRVSTDSEEQLNSLNDPTQFEQVDETCRLGRVVLYSKSLGMAGVS